MAMLRRRVDNCADCELFHGSRCVFAPRAVKADSVLNSQGTVPSEVGFIKSGIVAVSATNVAGEQTWGAVRGPRSLLGFEALEGEKSQCEIRALTEVEMCSATVPTVKFMLGSPDGARRLFGLTLTEVLEQRRDVDFRSGSAEARVARFALACERLIGHGSGRPISKARVAALVGIRPETLSRILRRFSAHGLLDSKSGIRVLKRAALATLADGDSTEGR